VIFDLLEQCPDFSAPASLDFVDPVSFCSELPSLVAYHAELKLVQIQRNVTETFERARKEQRELDKEQSARDELRARDQKTRIKKQKELQRAAQLPQRRVLFVNVAQRMQKHIRPL
jgi:hypothetical protein